MSRLSPKPIIAHVAQTWDVPPGMKIALVEDIERCLWVVESCPVGTHFWTLAQAQSLPQTGRVGQALRAAIAVGHQRLAAQGMETRTEAAASVNTPVVSAPQPSIKNLDRTEFLAPRRVRETAGSPSGITRSLRRASRRESKVPACS